MIDWRLGIGLALLAALFLVVYFGLWDAAEMAR
jgi:hypothetical protein